MRASTLEAIFIFVCPPSFEELEKRLRSRWADIILLHELMFLCFVCLLF